MKSEDYNNKSLTGSAESEYVELVNRVQNGCQKSLNELVELVSGKLKTYIYRLTLDANLTEDLLQETLLQMIKSVKDLRDSRKFWAWLYRTATGKVYHHYRSKNRKGKTLSLTDMDLYHSNNGITDSQDDGLDKAMRAELVKSVFKAMAKLKLNHRNVLVLRCLEQRPFSEVAQIMNCNETTARVTFFRAKHDLKKKLARGGFSKLYFVPAIGLFGKATSSSKAATTNILVAGSAMEAGLLATMIGYATTKIGLAIAAVIIAIGAITPNLWNSENNNIANLPCRENVQSFCYFEQAWDGKQTGNTNLLRGRSLSKGAYEQWFYFPEGIDGPMFMAMQRWDPTVKSKLCSWKQDETGNYYYHSGSRTIYIHNYRLPMRYLTTRRLPSDSKEFTDFLDSMEGKKANIEYHRDPKTGLLTGVLDDRFHNAKNFYSSIKWNKFDKVEFDNFRHRWADDANVVDERDELHKNLQAYVKITGSLNNKPITGQGCIVFIYDKLKETMPWLEINIADQMQVVDTQDGAVLKSSDGIETPYPAGTFFKGLAKPWMGMHTVDIVRREAAAERIKFTTGQPQQYADETDYDIGVTFTENSGGDAVKLEYHVAYYSDLLNSINIFKGTEKIGEINFEYIIDNRAVAENKPDIQRVRQEDIQQMSGLWLMKLADGSL